MPNSFRAGTEGSGQILWTDRWASSHLCHAEFVPEHLRRHIVGDGDRRRVVDARYPKSREPMAPSPRLGAGEYS
jgi:hypothetical protein